MEPTSFLYPFIDGEERDEVELLGRLARSAVSKMTESAELAARTLEALDSALCELGDAMASRFRRGGTLYCFGNGGSATDAEAVTEWFLRPAVGTPLAARSLSSDSTILTALANDVGVDVVFARQVAASVTALDIALGISTSGDSINVIDGLLGAKRLGALTIGLAGYGGGRMGAALDHCLSVDSESVHRVQEIQTVIWHELWTRVQRVLSQAGGPG